MDPDTCRLVGTRIGAEWHSRVLRGSEYLLTELLSVMWIRQKVLRLIKVQEEIKIWGVSKNKKDGPRTSPTFQSHKGRPGALWTKSLVTDVVGSFVDGGPGSVRPPLPSAHSEGHSPSPPGAPPWTTSSSVRDLVPARRSQGLDSEAGEQDVTQVTPRGPRPLGGVGSSSRKMDLRRTQETRGSSRGVIPAR